MLNGEVSKSALFKGELKNMCRIVGAAAGRPITEILIQGLKHLVYCGYDSACIAMLDQPRNLAKSGIVE